MIALPEIFLTVPLAHRGLHDAAAGRPENSLEAARAAIDAGYGIELDIQGTRDHAAMVFHDYDMARLTGWSGAIRDRLRGELDGIGLMGNGEPVPELGDFLGFVAGRAPLLVEIKDRDGTMGPKVGPLERAVARALCGYAGPVAVMSFNPHSVAVMAECAPDIPRGLVTGGWTGEDLVAVPSARRDELRAIPDFARVGASFISHAVADLANHRVAELRKDGARILCWTVRSMEQEARARMIADNVTFEGYMAERPTG